jgi:oligoribonuclease
MSQNESNLVWVDLEMTGLEPDQDKIIEIAVIITDSELNSLAEGPVLAIHQDESILSAMDEWNTSHHGSSGLLDRVRKTDVSVADAEQQVLDFVDLYVPAGSSPMCGNSICQDRRFMARYMPKLEAWFHYRNLDVSTLKILAERWNPAAYDGVEKKETHQALDDIRESVEELRHYRKTLLMTP